MMACLRPKTRGLGLGNLVAVGLNRGQPGCPGTDHVASRGDSCLQGRDEVRRLDRRAIDEKGRKVRFVFLETVDQRLVAGLLQNVIRDSRIHDDFSLSLNVT
jgi:hypothetical protein